MAEPTQYAVTLLPHSHPDSTTWTRLVTNQKTLRLQSLQISPESLGSTYEREIAFTDPEWEARLQNPMAFTFIAHKASASAPKDGDLQTEGINPEDSAKNALIEGDWVGCAVLMGPLDQLPVDVYEKLFGKGGGISVGEEERNTVKEFVIQALFVMPDARGAGLGKRLVDAAIAHAKTMAKENGAEEVLFKMAGAVDNVRALKLYEAWGFMVVERFMGERKELVGMEMRVDVS